jgi:hypothetical protein
LDSSVVIGGDRLDVFLVAVSLQVARLSIGLWSGVQLGA